MNGKKRTIKAVIVALLMATACSFTVQAEPIKGDVEIGISPDGKYGSYIMEAWGGTVECKPYVTELIHKNCYKYGIIGKEQEVMAIIANESLYRGKVIHENDDGSKDYGIGQNNSCWSGKIKKKFGWSMLDLLDVSKGVEATVWIYAFACHNKDNKNFNARLIEYNSGKSGRNKTTSSYSRRVARTYETIRGK